MIVRPEDMAKIIEELTRCCRALEIACKAAADAYTQAIEVVYEYKDRTESQPVQSAIKNRQSGENS